MLQLVILPVTAWYFYEIPVYAMLLNLLVLPFVGIVLASGIAGGLLGCAVMPQAVLVHIVLLPCHVILSGYEKICTIASGLPHALLITGKPSAVKITVYYLLLAVGLFLLSHVTKRQKEMQQMTEENGRQKRRKSYRGMEWSLFACGLGLLVFCLHQFHKG